MTDHALSNPLVPPEAGVRTSDTADHYHIFLKINYIPSSRTVLEYELVRILIQVEYKLSTS